MKTTFITFLSFIIFSILSCSQDNRPTENPALDTSRPISPWVFRSVLDTKPRMITLALAEKLYVSYSNQYGRLYKAWQGEVDFDGAVYTTVHGPQPLAVGDAYIIDQETSTPWSIIENNREVKPDFQYKGHRFANNKVELMYELKWNDNAVKITKEVEYLEVKRGVIGLERTFKNFKRTDW